jgi:hypothetical protein
VLPHRPLAASLTVAPVITYPLEDLSNSPGTSIPVKNVWVTADGA